MQLDIIYGDRDVSGAKCAKTPKSRRRKPRQSWELHIDVFLENSLYISCIYFIPSNILIWYAYICTLFLRFLQFISTKMALIYFIWNSWAVAPWLLMTWSQAKLSTKTDWYVFLGVAAGGPSSRWYQVWKIFGVIGIKIPSRISVFLKHWCGCSNICIHPPLWKNNEYTPIDKTGTGRSIILERCIPVSWWHSQWQ